MFPLSKLQSPKNCFSFSPERRGLWDDLCLDFNHNTKLVSSNDCQSRFRMRDGCVHIQFDSAQRRGGPLGDRKPRGRGFRTCKNLRIFNHLHMYTLGRGMEINGATLVKDYIPGAPDLFKSESHGEGHQPTVLSLIDCLGEGGGSKIILIMSRGDVA